MAVLGASWIFAAIGQPHRAYLHGIAPQVFNEYLDYLLGEYVWGLHSSTVSGAPGFGPPWQLVLAYEGGFRRKARKLIMKGDRFVEALRKAWEDPAIKERRFTTPLATMPARAQRDVDEPRAKYARTDKGKG